MAFDVAFYTAYSRCVQIQERLSGAGYSSEACEFKSRQCRAVAMAFFSRTLNGLSYTSLSIKTSAKCAELASQHGSLVHEPGAFCHDIKSRVHFCVVTVIRELICLKGVLRPAAFVP